ncbi:hypothetical protein [Patulibacter minatonensis]|uniref:hypothetical protein n=1 Tax=Patulibacter minatonensis TaxID=298163 RepID=UPI00047C50B2|nr:hypothetical protein [Patulibacter minatonensis]
MEITTFWVQGHGLREFVGAADPVSPRFEALTNEAVGMAATIGGAWATVVVDVPDDLIVDAFARIDPVA